MWSNFEPNVKATIAFLKLLNVKVSNTTVNETLQNHPDWPSLLCISDSLNKWHIPNAAGKIDKHDIEQLPTPFLAYTNYGEKQLAIITKITKTEIYSHQKKYNKPNIETPEEFFKKWNGVYLIAEPHQHSGERDYEKSKRKEFFQSLIPVAAFATLITISFLLLGKTVDSNKVLTPFSTIGIYLQYCILLTGTTITSLLLWYEMDKNNPVLQKFCTGITKGDCNAILTGKQAKVFKGLSWSEVGFFYFTGGLFTLLFAESSVAVLAWMSLLALPYTIFSVYYQWRVAKQWCILCLIVQALLILGGINVLFNSFLLPLPHLSAAGLTKVLLLYFLPVLIWYASKPYLLRLQEAKNTKREYLRIKFNPEIFDALLKKQKSITIPPERLGINLGNPAATNTLVKVCNPYCGPCSKAHPKIESLLEQHHNLRVKIIFTVPNPNEEDNILIKPVRHLMAIYGKNEETVVKKALDDWYLSDKKNYDLFASKYPMNGELLQQGDKIDAMIKWCKTVEVIATPSIFINGYQLPDAYNIEDLEYFLLE